MSCDICGRIACEPWFHSGEEQSRFETVIAAFEHARELRRQLNADLDVEAVELEIGKTKTAEDEFILDGTTPCPECKFTEKHLSGCKYRNRS